MANIKSQKKRILIAERNNIANSSFKTRMRHAIKKVKVALEAKDLAKAESLLPEAVSLIDKSVKNGIQHSNTAARQKSSLMNGINALKANGEAK